MGIGVFLRKFHTFIHGSKMLLFYTDLRPLIHIFKQTHLAAAFQQWLDVILDYDLLLSIDQVLCVMPNH